MTHHTNCEENIAVIVMSTIIVHDSYLVLITRVLPLANKE